MELDTRSRDWIVTFTVPDINVVDDTCASGDGTAPPFKWAHAKLSSANGTCSIWLSYNNPQRASTLQRVFNEHDHLVLKRITSASYRQFCDVVADREFKMTPPASPVVPPAQHDVLDPPIHCANESGSDSDGEIRTLLRRRAMARRKVRQLEQARDELRAVNELIRSKLTD